MPAFYDKASLVAVLPPLRRGRIRDPRLRKWLARGTLVEHARPPELLSWVLAAAGHPRPVGGEGALRYWGETGDRPTGWMAAADPVYLEPRLDHLCVHAPLAAELPVFDVEPLAEHLDRTLGEASPFEFTCPGQHIYLRSSAPIATAASPPDAAHGERPNAFLPDGPGAAEHRRLLSEIEMALFEHPVNLERQRRGLHPVNSLWIWGGGIAPEEVQDPAAPLFTDEALLRGAWASKSALAMPWPGSFETCFETSDAGLVAVAPETVDAQLLEQWLGELRAALSAGRISSLVLLSRDGLELRMRRSHAARFWRRDHALLGAAHDGA